mgnify:CR=1 FL=1
MIWIALLLLSPRTWGWTAAGLEREVELGVVPTHVGVDRSAATSEIRTTSCPHARGGGPVSDRVVVVECELSPRTWGWTVRWRHAARAGRVVPTHVGVDLPSHKAGLLRRCCPHARGGGPVWAAVQRHWTRLSPRTWGWTGAGRGLARAGGVVPTHVGVDPHAALHTSGILRCPHARGGGPPTTTPSAIGRPLSPRTWGWTVRRGPGRRAGRVVPTHVGVDLEALQEEFARLGCPHARGGGPPCPSRSAGSPRLSPRTWGWTEWLATHTGLMMVVPTHVGVDLPQRRGHRYLRRCPHARGGGPV